MSTDGHDIPLDLLAALLPPVTPKVFCGVQVRTNLTQQRNYVIANCTREEGHTDIHVDCHSGRKWN